MRYWLFMFRPDTYRLVREHGTVGVRHEHRRRFGLLEDGDRFVAYLSKVGLIDGHGRVEGKPFDDDTPIFGADVSYPHRCRVAFERTDAAAAAGDLLWELDQWEHVGKVLRTHPANMLFCYGGFMEIRQTDHERLVAAMSDVQSRPRQS